MPFLTRLSSSGGIVVAAFHEGVGHARHRRVRETLTPPVAGWFDPHQARVEPVLHIAFQDAILDQHGFARGRAFVINRQRTTAAAADRAVHRAVVDHRHAGRGDAFADAARKGARALAVEITFKAVADRFVEQHPGPAGAEQDGELARGGIDCAQIDERLRQRLVDRAVPLRRFEQMIVHIAPAEAEHAGLAATILFDDDRDIEADERADVGGEEAVGADDLDHRPAARERNRHLRDARVARARRGVDFLTQRDLFANGIRSSGFASSYR